MNSDLSTNETGYSGVPQLGGPTTYRGTGLATEDYVSIALGAVLILLIIAIIVGTILFKKGYLGQKVSPSDDGLDEKPKLISYFSRSGTSLYSESIGGEYNTSPRPEYKPGPESNPIIYLYDDIYYPPNTRPLPDRTTKGDKSTKRKKRKKMKKRRPERAFESSPAHRQDEQKRVTDSRGRIETMKIIEEEDEDIVVIPDTRINIYVRYGYPDPYSDWEPAFIRDIY